MCGKPIEGKGVRITKGTLRSGEWKERSLFGNAHESCFAQAIKSPKMVVDELRRAAREQSTRSSTS